MSVTTQPIVTYREPHSVLFRRISHVLIGLQALTLRPLPLELHGVAGVYFMPSAPLACSDCDTEHNANEVTRMIQNEDRR